jgi:hypothetical protein
LFLLLLIAEGSGDQSLNFGLVFLFGVASELASVHDAHISLKTQ